MKKTPREVDAIAREDAWDLVAYWRVHPPEHLAIPPRTPPDSTGSSQPPPEMTEDDFHILQQKFGG